MLYCVGGLDMHDLMILTGFDFSVARVFDALGHNQRYEYGYVEMREKRGSKQIS